MKMFFLVVTALVVAALVVVALAALAWVYDPARVAAEVAYRARADAIALARQQAEAQWWGDVRNAWKPGVVVAGLAALGSLAGLFLAGAWVAFTYARAHVAHKTAFVYPDGRGLLPMPRDHVAAGVYTDHAALALQGYHGAQQAAAATPRFSGAARSERLNVYHGRPAPRSTDAPAPVSPWTVETPAAPLALPGPTDLRAILPAPPTLDRITLALAPGGVPLVVTARDLCHVALAGTTGGGKSNIMRALLAQLLAAGAHVVLADPHYAPIDPDSGEDWRPIASRLARPIAVTYNDIADVLNDIDGELTARLERRRVGDPIGPPLFLAADELPAINANVEGAADVLTRVLREGRKVKILTVCAAQDFLVKSLGTSSGARDCFQSVYYVGGDPTTARALLDVKGNPDAESGVPLGKGVTLLRSRATPTPSLVRVPLASNESIAGLLGAPAAGGGVPVAPAAPSFTPFSTTTTTTTTNERPVVGDAAREAAAREAEQDARIQRVGELRESGKSRSSIAREVFGRSGDTELQRVDALLGEYTRRYGSDVA